MQQLYFKQISNSNEQFERIYKICFELNYAYKRYILKINAQYTYDNISIKFASYSKKEVIKRLELLKIEQFLNEESIIDEIIMLLV